VEANVTDELESILPPLPAATRCAHCAGPLPAPIERLAIVHGPDAELVTTCSAACLAGLTLALAGEGGEPTARRMQ
jgi:hypothetical protein